MINSTGKDGTVRLRFFRERRNAGSNRNKRVPTKNVRLVAPSDEPNSSVRLPPKFPNVCAKMIGIVTAAKATIIVLKLGDRLRGLETIYRRRGIKNVV